MKENSSQHLKFNPYLERLYHSDKPLIIYKVQDGYNLYTDFSKKIILTKNNINSTEWAFEQVIHKEKFIDYAKSWNDFGVDFVGGCCGINVEHIKELAKIIK